VLLASAARMTAFELSRAPAINASPPRTATITGTSTLVTHHLDPDSFTAGTAAGEPIAIATTMRVSGGLFSGGVISWCFEGCWPEQRWQLSRDIAALFCSCCEDRSTERHQATLSDTRRGWALLTGDHHHSTLTDRRGLSMVARTIPGTVHPWRVRRPPVAYRPSPKIDLLTRSHV